jgi:hypothetical protein
MIRQEKKKKKKNLDMPKNGAAYATAGSLSQSWDRGPNFSLYFFFLFSFIYIYIYMIGV